MLEVLKELVRNIVLIVLLAAFLDLILPSSKMSSYIKMVMGLFVLVSILNPLLAIFLHRQEFEVMAWQEESAFFDSASYLEKSERLAEVNRGIFRQEYGRRMEMQMEALVKLVRGVEEAWVKVELEGDGQAGDVKRIRSVLVTVGIQGERKQGAGVSGVEPVKVGVGNGESNTENNPARQAGSEKQATNKNGIEREIKNMLGRYFELQEGQIRVVFNR
ncbi:MAG: stage III sporulation protein AF [Peptococcaceae bacterium]|jgi:stage III sporulation protein AF|nr:stage III sporulation protein AF [Peptococcaceae bacterium]MDH7525350.1 stage III sporulation protein AF [Peptococcaceae bacterium]